MQPVILRRVKLAALLLVIFLSANAQVKSRISKPQQPQLKTHIIGEPVVVEHDTLFRFYANQGLFDMKDRAEIVTKRISQIVAEFDFNADSLKLKNDSLISAISYKSQLVMAINDKDAAYLEIPRQQLAARYLNILKKKLGAIYDKNSIKQITIQVAESVAVLAVLILLIYLANKAFRWLRYKLIKGWESRVAMLAQKGAPEGYLRHLLPILVNALRVLRLFLIVLFVYLALPIAFSIFPATKPIATELLGYVIKPVKDIFLAIVRYVPNLLTITVIYLATHYIIKLVKFIAGEIESGSFTIKNFYPEWASPTYNIIKVLLYAFMFIVIYPYLPGSQSDVFKGVTVFLGVLFSFGSSSAVSNMVAGIVLTYMRPFKIGDRVKLGDVTGDVIEKNMLVTRIRTIKNEDITMPNSQILTGAAINYSSSAKDLGLILHTSVTIGYDAPWQVVHELMINAALATEGILKDPKPFVLQTALNDFNVSYQVNAYTDQPHRMAGIYSELHRYIQDKFNEAGVEIMSPHFSALRDGNAIQIPDDYKPKDYRKPGFSVGLNQD